MPKFVDLSKTWLPSGAAVAVLAVIIPAVWQARGYLEDARHRLSTLEQRTDENRTTLDVVNTRTGRIEGRLDRIERKLDGVSSSANEHHEASASSSAADKPGI